MKPKVPRVVSQGLVGTLALAALTLAPTQATAAPALTLTENCDLYPPFSSVAIHLSGLPPNEQFTGTLKYFDGGGGFGPYSFNVDENGSFDLGIGSDVPHTYKATVEWAGGTLEATKRIDCTLPVGSPIPDAGADQTAASGALVSLDGSGSFDPDGDPLTYEWTQTDGPRVGLSKADTATPTFTTPKGPAALTFHLEVCDDGSPALCKDDTTTVKVKGPPPARPPTLTVAESCEGYPSDTGIVISIHDLPGYEPFTGTLEGFEGGIRTYSLGSVLSWADESGGSSYEGNLQQGPGTYVVTVDWAGGTLRTAKRIDCSDPQVPDSEYGARLKVNRPTWSTGAGRRARGFTVKVTNHGDGPLAVTADDIASGVRVNGALTRSAELVSTRVPKPGKRIKFHYLWRYRGVVAGDEVEYYGCVGAAGDTNSGNDCRSLTTTAVPKP